MGCAPDVGHVHQCPCRGQLGMLAREGPFPESCGDVPPAWDPGWAGGVGAGGRGSHCHCSAGLAPSRTCGWRRCHWGRWCVCVCAREQGPCPVWADMGVSPAPPRLSCRILSHPRGASSQEWPPSRFLPAACPHGRFGLGCAHVCRCGQGAACDPVTGTCTCPPGRTGVHCEHGESRLLPRELEVMG